MSLLSEVRSALDLVGHFRRWRRSQVDAAVSRWRDKAGLAAEFGKQANDALRRARLAVDRFAREDFLEPDTGYRITQPHRNRITLASHAIGQTEVQLGNVHAYFGIQTEAGKAASRLVVSLRAAISRFDPEVWPDLHEVVEYAREQLVEAQAAYERFMETAASKE